IPLALGSVVEGLVSLSDLHLEPMGHHIEPAYTTAGGSTHAMSPYDFAAIYNVLPLWNQGLDGSSQSIAIVDRSNINLDDVTNFRSRFGLAANKPEIILNGPDPGIVKGDEGEADLDVEWTGAVAKGAAIKLIVSASTRATDGVYLSAKYIVDQNVAPVLSMSFGLCELKAGVMTKRYADLWQQAATQGMSVLVSSGDSGSAGCDSASAGFALRGLNVSGASATPYNVAVGGTMFDESGADSAYWHTVNDRNGASAKGYIPEVVWNESSPG